MHWPSFKIVVRRVFAYHKLLYGGSQTESIPSTTSLIGSPKRERPSHASENESGIPAAARTASAPIPLLKTMSSDVADGGASVKDNPGGQSGSNAKKPKQASSYLQQFPWILPAAETPILLADLRALLEEEGILSLLTSSAAITAVDASSDQSHSVALEEEKLQSSANAAEGGGQPPIRPGTAEWIANNSLTAIATNYMRIWLSLREVEFKDAHPRVTKAISTVVGYVHAQV